MPKKENVQQIPISVGATAVFVLVRKCIQPNPGGGGPSLALRMVSVKEKQATIAHFNAVENGLGKFLELIQASYTAQV